FSQRRRDPDDPKVWMWGITAGEYMRRGPGYDWYAFDEEKWLKLPATAERKTVKTAVRSVPYKLPELIEAIAKASAAHTLKAKRTARATASISLKARASAMP